ncbi:MULTISPECIES: hypothetical protein [Bacillus]|uniref:Uncharacterized protein n=1 Tax=Bacillus capparidis TaxID=1840411 RepID=A0ABS4CZG4_9BACI|nr:MULTISPECIES: hypothetical protein [Bacillus]MBP1082783.1 hypothetical protein [Bacillus capparidis]MED1098427.1 hypothetical protein [Bacillus capparidis]
MGLKRNKKRKSNQPHTKQGDWGFKTITKKIEKALGTLDKKY